MGNGANREVGSCRGSDKSRLRGVTARTLGARSAAIAPNVLAIAAVRVQMQYIMGKYYCFSKAQTFEFSLQPSWRHIGVLGVRHFYVPFRLKLAVIYIYPFVFKLLSLLLFLIVELFAIANPEIADKIGSPASALMTFVNSNNAIIQTINTQITICP